jgi:hypothetical protein
MQPRGVVHQCADASQQGERSLAQLNLTLKQSRASLGEETGHAEPVELVRKTPRVADTRLL